MRSDAATESRPVRVHCVEVIFILFLKCDETSDSIIQQYNSEQ